MLDPEEIRWLKATANELNNLIQVISDSSRCLKNSGSGTEDERLYAAMLANGVDRAAQVTRAMVDRLENAMEVSPPEPPKERSLSGPTPPLRIPFGSPAIHNPSGPRELILIVDDEELVTLLAQHVLSEQGYRVMTATDGFAAIEIYQELKDEISLVVLDFSMPMITGANVFEELQKINPRVPVVLSSGFVDHRDMAGMLAKGLRGFIPKPYTQDKLLSEIRTVLDVLIAERAQTGA
jgi:CheY-like chemotaxis protein